MRNLFFLFAAIFALSGCSLLDIFTGDDDDNTIHAATLTRTNRKHCVYWTQPTMSAAEAQSIAANADLLIIDPENWHNNRSVVQSLKAMNPNLKLYVYWNVLEIFDPMVSGRKIQKTLDDYIKSTAPSWYLNSPDGQPTRFTGGPGYVTPWPMRLTNMTSACPSVGGRKFSSFLAAFVIQNVISHGIYDGLLVDCCWDDISWLNSGNYDANRDGVKDNAAQLDAWLRSGMTTFLAAIKAGVPDNFRIIGNEPNLQYTAYLKGKMFENFPSTALNGGDWNLNRDHYFRFMDMGLTDTLINMPEGAVNDQQLMLGYATALLHDGYFGWGQNTTSWVARLDQLVPYDIGAAQGPARLQAGPPAVWVRDFANATVTVDPATKTGKIVQK